MALFLVSLTTDIPQLEGEYSTKESAVSLGKPSSAALEKLSAQTEALMDEAATKTGAPTAFVNVQTDFLQA